MLTVPDAPFNVVEVISLRTATTIGLSWTAGANNGGSVVIDYTVSFDQGNGTFVVL